MVFRGRHNLPEIENFVNRKIHKTTILERKSLTAVYKTLKLALFAVANFCGCVIICAGVISPVDTGYSGMGYTDYAAYVPF